MFRGLSGSAVVIGLLVGLVTVVPASTASAAGGGDRTILIVGDSATAGYNDVAGDARQGWWSMVADEIGGKPVLSARADLGFLHYGDNCRGSRFGSRLPAVSEVRPDLLIVAGGRSDVRTCVNGRSAPATAAQASAAIKQYMSALRKRTDAIKLRPSRVAVLSPWGPDESKRRSDIRSSVRYWAEKNGFRWVPTYALSQAQTTDGRNPNAAGNKVLADQVVAAMDHTRTMMVIGDSMTSYASNTKGDPKRGWWSFVAEDLDMKPVTSAAAGSGFLRYGAGCTATRFGTRLPAVTSVRPDLLIVAGGYNDIYKCVKTRSVPSSPAEVSAAVKSYMASLRQKTDGIGLKPSKVYVMSPWGSTDRDRVSDIRSSVRYWAEKQGFHWIPTHALSAGLTVDGKHPNTAGHRQLTDQVQAAVR